MAVQHLEELRAGLALVEMQYGESSFFRESEPDLSLAATLGHIPVLTAAARRSESSEVRHAAAMLDGALDRLARRIAADFLHGHHLDSSQTLRLFGADHMEEPPSGLNGNRPSG